MNNVRSIILGVILSAGVLALLGIHSCKSSRNLKSPAPNEDIIVDDHFRKLIADKELYSMTRDVVPVDTAFINSDTLHFLTKKLQVCDADNFKLIWNGMILKSLPPQANFKLLVVGDATCKEQHAFHLMFTLSPLHFKQDSLHHDRSTFVKINNWNRTLQYNF